ncbi:MAG: thioredoxin family protein [Rhizobiaceae bacterium]
MLTRRAFTSLLAAAPVLPLAAPAQAALSDDGLHVQPFFVNSFLDMTEDKAEAEAKGKHFAVFFEQRGCPYCKEMHEVNLTKPEILSYVTDNFAAVQINLFGSREVTDFDGTVMEERAFARKWFVNFTPTIVFFAKGEAGKVPGPQAEAIRMPGYFKPFHFVTMFEFVAAEAFKTTDFQRFLQEKADRFAAEGKKVDLW